MKLRNEISNTKDKQQREELRNRRKEVKKEMKMKIKEHEEKLLNERLITLERFKDDSNKYYAVMRELKNKQNKKTIIVWDSQTKEIAGSTEEKINITEHFKSALTPATMKNEYHVSTQRNAKSFQYERSKESCKTS